MRAGVTRCLNFDYHRKRGHGSNRQPKRPHGPTGEKRSYIASRICRQRDPETAEARTARNRSPILAIPFGRRRELIGMEPQDVQAPKSSARP